MPELPEVETVCRGIAPALKGRKFAQVVTRRGNLRTPFPKDFCGRIEGKRVTHITRRAKYILIYLKNGPVLVIHLGMSGSLVIHPKGKAPALRTHDHVIFTLDNGMEMRFHDPRRFGLMALVDESELATHPLFAHLGPEPLDKTFTAAYLQAALQGRKIPIKPAIMNQEIVVGVGNIYASEALYLAHISPLRPANALKPKEYQALVEAIRHTLQAAIKSGGSTLRDYVRSTGDKGWFQLALNVYQREGLPCLCSASKDTMKSSPLVKKIVQQARATYYCPRCQK